MDETVYPDGPFPGGGGYLPPPRALTRTGTTALTRSRLNSAWNLLPSLPAARIALLDTGVHTTHPNLDGRVDPGYDYVLDQVDVVDTYGHGTAMAGALAGSGTGPSGSTFRGACSACRLLPYRVLAAPGEVTAVEFNARAALAVRAALAAGVDVIVFGVTSPVHTDDLASAIQEALAQGIPVVVPAGNDGATELEFPASLPGVLSVGATYNATDLLHERSNNGPELSVVAPGESMVSLAPGGGFAVFGHTSLAAAMVGGTAALLRGARPTLNALAVTSLIRGQAVPLEPAPSSEVLGLGRLDAHAALEQVAGPIGSITTLSDLAIGHAGLIPVRPRAGGKAWAVVRLENRGITDMDLAGRAVRLWVDNRYVNKRPLQGVLRPGERLELRVFWPVTQAAGHHPVAVELVHPEGSGDNVPGNDLYAIQEASLVPRAAPDLSAPLETRRALPRAELMLDPEVVAGDRADLRIVAITSPDVRRVGTSDRTFHVHLANHGTQPEVGRRLSWTLSGQPQPEVSVPDLAPGEEATVELAWRDFTGGDVPITVTLQAQLVPPPGGAVGPLQRHAFRFRYLPSGGAARTEYVDAPGQDMVVDAPFRIDSSRDEIPVLFFAPDYGEEEISFSRMNLAVSNTADFSLSQPRVQPIYTQVDDRGSASWGPAVVVDAWGQTQANGFSTLLFPTGPLRQEDQGGWHAILRVPWSHLEAKMAPATDDPDGPAFYLQGSIYVKRRVTLWRRVSFAGEDELVFRRVLKVRRNTLPRLSGRALDRYFDAHFHTINEYVRTPSVFSGYNHALLPMKAWGGPLGMAVESAHAQGFITQAERDGWASGSSANRIAFTDHNVFLSTVTSVSKSPDDCPGFGPTAPAAGQSCHEFAVMRNLFDKGAGEEIAVAGGAHLLPIPLAEVRGGGHLLSYGDVHRDGPWHGGSFTQPNPLEVGALLGSIAAGPATDDPFSYAAHPFAKPLAWTGESLTRALGYGATLPAHPNAGYTFKGFQVWNQKKEYCRSFTDVDLFATLNPFPGARSNTEWAKTAIYRNWIKDNTREWESRIRKGLRYADPDGRGTFFRKVFAVGGTDAHGDFNYTTDITSTLTSTRIIHGLFMGDDEHSVCSNAWGMVRTLAAVEACATPADCPRGLTCAAGACVGPREQQNAPALSAMGHGRAVVSDGPVAHLALDAQTQFSSRTLEWDDSRTSFTPGTEDPWFDVDGYMGGAGRFDGAGTALMPVDGPVFDDTWTSHWNSTPNFVRAVASWGGNAAQALARTFVTYVFPAETNQNERDLLHSSWDQTEEYSVPAEETVTYLQYAAGNNVPATGQFRASSSEPFALYYHGLSGPRPAYQVPAFQFLTNPIWVAPVPAMVRNEAECVNQSARLLQVAVRLRVPLTLDAAQPFTEVYLQPLDPTTGRSGGTKYPLAPSPGFPRDTGLGWSRVQRGEYEYRAKLNLQLAGKLTGSSGGFIIVFRDPQDIHGNVLNSFAVRRWMPACVDTPTQKPWCCEFNPAGMSRGCFSTSPNGACGGCGVVCRATERCEGGACVDNLGAWTCAGVSCVPPAVCCYGRCMMFVNNDEACGACGNPCAKDERCCGTTCVKLGTPANCLDCGDTCGAGQTCCKFSGCKDLSSDTQACGGCLRQCSSTHEPLCALGNCQPRDDEVRCGSLGTMCGAGEGCCPVFSSHDPFTIADYTCRRLDTASDCSKCNERCRADRCAKATSGMRCGDECDDGPTCSEGVCQ